MPTKMITLGVRVPEEMRDALNAAARDDLRSAASLVEKVLAEWLRERGYLGEPIKAGAVRRRIGPRRTMSATPAPAPEPEPAEPVPAGATRGRPRRQQPRPAPA